MGEKWGKMGKKWVKNEITGLQKTVLMHASARLAAIQTLLLSFCLDEDKFNRGLYKEKLDSTGRPDPRMFCVVNEKVGLIKLVSGSVKKQVRALPS